VSQQHVGMNLHVHVHMGAKGEWKITMNSQIQKNQMDNSNLCIKMALRVAGLHAVGFGTMIFQTIFTHNSQDM